MSDFTALSLSFSILKVRFIIPPYSVTTAAARSLQSCPTLCNPIDGSPRGSPVPGIIQARTLEWVAILLMTIKKSRHSGIIDFP